MSRIQTKYDPGTFVRLTGFETKENKHLNDALGCVLGPSRKREYPNRVSVLDDPRIVVVLTVADDKITDLEPEDPCGTLRLPLGIGSGVSAMRVAVEENGGE